MIDAETVILEELDRLAPFEYIDPTHLTRRRALPGLRLALLVPLVVAALVVPAITMSADLRSLIGLQVGPDQPVLSKAQPVVSAPIGQGYYAHLWQAPGSQAGRCQLVTLDRSESSSTRPLSANGGAGCTAYARLHFKNGTTSRVVILLSNGVWVTATAQDRLSVHLTTQLELPAGAPTNAPPYLVGAVYPGLHATRVELEWNGGSKQLALAHNHFIGGSPQLVRPPYRNLPYTVVVYNAAGHEVAHTRLLTPQLYLVQGWAAFRSWKHAHPHG